jgi:MraZ protein
MPLIRACVFTPSMSEIIETKLRALPSLREENRRLQRLLIGNAVDLELDGSGRFLVPPRLREYARVG